MGYLVLPPGCPGPSGPQSFPPGGSPKIPRDSALVHLPHETTSERPKVVRDRQLFFTLDFEMCFAPQRRALFRHLNFQKRSENGVLCTFWLGNVLRATAAYNFSSLIWPDGSAPAALASLLFDSPEPQIIRKTQWIATSLPFGAPASSSFSLFLLSALLTASLLLWLFPPLLFHLSILSQVWLLNFLRSWSSYNIARLKIHWTPDMFHDFHMIINYSW